MHLAANGKSRGALFWWHTSISLVAAEVKGHAFWEVKTSHLPLLYLPPQPPRVQPA